MLLLLKHFLAAVTLSPDRHCYAWQVYVGELPTTAAIAIALVLGSLVGYSFAWVRQRQRLLASSTPTPNQASNQHLQVEAALQPLATARRRSEYELADCFEHTVIGLQWIGPDGTILRVNQAELNLLGYNREEYLGHSLSEFYVDPAVGQTLLEQLKEQGTLHCHEAQLRCKDGSTKDVLIDANVLWENGKFIHARYFTRDITERQRLAQASQQAKAELERRVQERTEKLFLANAELRHEIAERQRIETTLQRDQEFLKAVLENISDGVVACNSEGILTFFNRATRELHGLPEAPLPTDQWADYYGLCRTDSKQPLKTEEVPLFRALQGELVYNTEILIQPRSGSAHSVVVNGQAIFNDRGEKLGAVVALHDVTERKLAEAALIQSHDFYLTLLEEFPALIWRASTNAERNFFNQTWLTFTGRTLAEESHEGWLEGIHPADLDNCLRTYRDAFKARQPFAMEYRLRQVDGEYRWLLDQGRPFNDIHGNFAGYIGTCCDITERKWAEAALQESEKQYRSVVENLKEVIFQTDSSGLWMFLNPAWAEITGFTIAESLGTHFLDYVHPEDCAAHLQLFQRLMDRKESGRLELRYLTKDGNYRWVELFARSTYDRDRNLLGTSGTLNDITDRKQAEQALSQANSQLANWVNELERRNCEITLLSEMSNTLQACLSVDEAYTAIAQLMQPLFPQTSGSIFTLNSTRTLTEAVATWGEAFTHHKLFVPNDCWALRRGRSHCVLNSHNGLICKHLAHPLPSSYCCVPMIAQGEALGLLYISFDSPEALTEAKQRLAVTAAEQIALALANLRLRESLQQQSIRDALTGLFNRRYLEESLERELHRAHRKNQTLGLIMLDIDHFKHFNDTLGHEAGDVILRELGLFLKNHVRGADIACRYGGEEFLLILPEASLESTQWRAEQLRDRVRQLQVRYQGQCLSNITASMGVALFPLHAQSSEVLIKAADLALYEAKARGRDRIVIAQEVLREY